MFMYLPFYEFALMLNQVAEQSPQVESQEAPENIHDSLSQLKETVE